MSSQVSVIAGEWAVRAHDLAHWAMSRLVNRDDVWVQYLPLHERSYSKIVRTAPPKLMRGKVHLALDVLKRHFVGADPGHLIGVHGASAEGTTRWLAIDIGNRDSRMPTTAAANLKAAVAWFNALRAEGFDPYLEDSDGRGSFHLVAMFEVPIGIDEACAFGRRLVGNYPEHGLSATPRLIPDRARAESGGFGDWLRLPGCHHSHSHWSRMWSGSEWLEGAAAVDAILGLRIPSAGMAPPELADVVPGLGEPPDTAPPPGAPPAEAYAAAPPQEFLVGTPPRVAVGRVPRDEAPPPGPTHAEPAVTDPDLQRVIAEWSSLPSALRAGITAMVEMSIRERDAVRTP